MSETQTLDIPLSQLSQDERDVIAARVVDGNEKQVTVGAEVGLNAQRMSAIVTDLRRRREEGTAPSPMQIVIMRSQLAAAAESESEAGDQPDSGIAKWLTGESVNGTDPADPGDHVQPVNEGRDAEPGDSVQQAIEQADDFEAAVLANAPEVVERIEGASADAPEVDPEKVQQFAETGDGHVLAEILGGELVEPEPAPEPTEAEIKAAEKARIKAQDEACAAYLAYCERPKVNRSETQMRATLRGAESRAETARGLDRLLAIQRCIELREQLTAHTNWPKERVSELERGFAENAHEWAARHGFSPEALQTFGVPIMMLRKLKLYG